jgi:hypothetical protein
MRSKLLIGTAALLAGVALASAQNMPGGGREAPAQSQGAQGGAAGDRQSPSPQSRPTQRGQDKQVQDKQVQDKQGQAQQGSQGQRGQKDQTTGARAERPA